MVWQAAQRPLPLKRVQPARASSRDGRGVAGQEAVEGGVEEDERALEGGDGALDVAVVDLAPVGLLKLGVVALLLQRGHGGRLVRHGHLHRVQDGLPGLVLQRGGPAVEELAVQERGVHRGGGVSPAELVAHPLGHRSPVGEAAGDVVAGRAGDGAVTATAPSRSRASGRARSAPGSGRCPGHRGCPDLAIDGRRRRQRVRAFRSSASLRCCSSISVAPWAPGAGGSADWRGRPRASAAPGRAQAAILGGSAVRFLGGARRPWDASRKHVRADRNNRGTGSGNPARFGVHRRPDGPRDPTVRPLIATTFRCSEQRQVGLAPTSGRCMLGP